MRSRRKSGCLCTSTVFGGPLRTPRKRWPPSCPPRGRAARARKENFRWSRRVGRVEALTGESNHAVASPMCATTHPEPIRRPAEQPSLLRRQTPAAKGSRTDIYGLTCGSAVAIALGAGPLTVGAGVADAQRGRSSRDYDNCQAVVWAVTGRAPVSAPLRAARSATVRKGLRGPRGGPRAPHSGPERPCDRPGRLPFDVVRRGNDRPPRPTAVQPSGDPAVTPLCNPMCNPMFGNRRSRLFGIRIPRCAVDDPRVIDSPTPQLR